MDLTFGIAFLRGPLEMISFGLALAPAFIVLQASGSVPPKVPLHFGGAGNPDRWISRRFAWIQPVLALIVYGVLSKSTGTWAWILNRNAETREGWLGLLLLKAGVGLLITYVSAMMMRIARREAEPLNGWLLWGLVILMLAPPLAVSLSAH